MKAHIKRLLEWSLIVIGAIALVVTARPEVASDGLVRFEAVRALLGDGGTLDIKFSLVQPVLSMPLAWLALALHLAPQQATAYYSIVFFFVCSVPIYRDIAWRHSPQAGRYWLLLVLAASMFPHHLQQYFSEVTTAMLLTVGVLRMDRSHWVSVAVFSLALDNTPAMLPAFGVIALLWLLLRKDWVLIASLVAAIAMILLEALIKTGGHLATPYLSDGEHGFRTVLPYSGMSGFSYPLMFGVLSVLLSFGKGLVFYIPGLLLFASAQGRRAISADRAKFGLSLAFSALVVGIYGSWWAWYGGGFWGPRFFLFLCVPASLSVAVLLTRASVLSMPMVVLLATVIVMSGWVCLDGYVYGQRDMDVCWQDNYRLEFLCWYVPEFSALWRPFVTGRISELLHEPRFPFACWQALAIGWLVLGLIRESMLHTRKGANVPPV